MDYGRIGPSDPGGSARSDQPLNGSTHYSTSSRKKKLLILTLVLSAALLLASAASAGILIAMRSRSEGVNSSLHRKPTQAISKTCSKTLYRDLCIASLLDFPGSMTANEQDLVHISFNMTLQHFNKALYLSSAISYLQMPDRVRSAYDDCLELLDDSVDSLSTALSAVLNPSEAPAKQEDVMTWLSAALTNQDTCTEGFADVEGDVKSRMSERLKDLSELVSNCLAIFSSTESEDFAGVPIQNKRRLLSEEGAGAGDFPRWLGRRERRLLGLPVSAIQADIVVSKDGNGTCKTISEAIKKAPENSDRRIVIYVRAGR